MSNRKRPPRFRSANTSSRSPSLTNTRVLDTSTAAGSEVFDGKAQSDGAVGSPSGILRILFEPEHRGLHTQGRLEVVATTRTSPATPRDPTAGGEIFCDASSIARRTCRHGKVLNFDLDFVNPAPPLPAPWQHPHIAGVAPGGFAVASSFSHPDHHDVEAAGRPSTSGCPPIRRLLKRVVGGRQQPATPDDGPIPSRSPTSAPCGSWRYHRR